MTNKEKRFEAIYREFKRGELTMFAFLVRFVPLIKQGDGLLWEQVKTIMEGIDNENTKK